MIAFVIDCQFICVLYSDHRSIGRTGETCCGFSVAVGGECMSGGIENYNQIVGKLKGMPGKSETVIKRTMSDMRNRVPGWVATEVVKVYGIKKGEVTPSKAGKGGKKAGNIRARGETIDSIEIVYTGRVLTPTHFGMTPKSAPPGRSYTLKASILKGSKSTLGKVKKLSKKQRAMLGKNFRRQGTRSSDHSPIMLMGNGGGGQIPFQRKSTNRKDVEAIKTVSLPQMVSSDRTKDSIERTINENLEKRLEQHMKLLLK